MIQLNSAVLKQHKVTQPAELLTKIALTAKNCTTTSQSQIPSLIPGNLLNELIITDSQWSNDLLHKKMEESIETT